jgi:hypothetical protein
VVIRIYSDDDESSCALANANDVLPLTTLPWPMKRSRGGVVDPKKQRAANPLPSRLGKCPETRIWALDLWIV